MSCCSACRGPRDRGDARYCRKCHAAYMRRTRPAYKDLPEEEKRRSRTRSYLRVMIRRGKVRRETCAVCGAAEAEAHHRDYSRPLDVQWLCRKHHKNLHKLQKAGFVGDELAELLDQ